MHGIRRSMAWCAPSRPPTGNWNARVTRPKSSRRCRSPPCPARATGRSACRLWPSRRLTGLLEQALDTGDAAIHIATEGPLGHAARRYCLARRLSFTTAYHTRFPQYLKAMFGIPEQLHLPVPSLLSRTGYRSDGTDSDGRARTARPRARQRCTMDARRRSRCHSQRVSPCSKTRVTRFSCTSAGCRSRRTSRRSSPSTCPAPRSSPVSDRNSRHSGRDSRRCASSASWTRSVWHGCTVQRTCSCFRAAPTPSGWSCSKRWPVARRWPHFPVQGPIDVVGGSAVAVLDEDLRKAALHALRIDRSQCRDYAERYSWRAATAQFIALQQPVRRSRPGPVVASPRTDPVNAVGSRKQALDESERGGTIDPFAY